MLTHFLRVCIYSGIATLSSVSAQLLPNSQALVQNELEHLYLDNPGPNSIKSTIIPCTNYVDSTTGLNNNTLGRQTAAQWIRTAFRKAMLPYVLQRMIVNMYYSLTLSETHVVSVTFCTVVYITWPVDSIK